MPRQRSEKRANGLREIIRARLALGVAASGAHHAAAIAHLDEDQLNAFVEGRLSEAESAPFISHLVSCAACRRATAELARLQIEIGDVVEAEPPAAHEEEVGRFRRFLEGLASHVTSSHDEVMAYHAPAEDFEHEGERGSEEPESAGEGKTGTGGDGSGGTGNEG